MRISFGEIFSGENGVVSASSIDTVLERHGTPQNVRDAFATEGMGLLAFFERVSAVGDVSLLVDGNEMRVSVTPRRRRPRR